MSRIWSGGAVAVTTVVVTALVVVATLLVFLGIGGALCVALGALIRRLGRAIRSGEGSQ